MSRWLREAGINLPRVTLKNRPRGADQSVTAPAAHELKRLYVVEELSMAAVAEQLGGTVHVVRTWLADAGIATRPGGGRPGVPHAVPRRKPAPAPEELRELHLVQRLGRGGVADHYQVHPSTASRWLMEAGLPTRLPPLPGTLTAAEMVALYRREGIPAAAIARRAGVPESRVVSALRTAGVAIDRSRQADAVRAAAARRASQAPLSTADGNWAQARCRDDGWSYRRIAESLGVPTGRVRRELKQRQVPPRARPVPGRAARIEAPIEEVRRLYVESQMSAEDVGGVLDVAGPIVLRTGHAHGLPIRQGSSPVVSATLELISDLYEDIEIAAVLDRHQIPLRPASGGIASRFPEPVPLSPELVRDLYLGAGCFTPQIELLTGQSQTFVRARMHEWGIPVRTEHLSPALMRLRAVARGRFLDGVLASYRELGSTTKVAAVYGCAPDTVRRWLLAAEASVPGRGRWARLPGVR